MHTQLVGIILGIIGLLGTGLICGLPAWKVTPFVGANIITAQIFWEGLWMNCVIQSTGQSQCKAYDSILALPRELQASRALVCVSLAVGAVAVGLFVLGARCTSFFRHDWPTKNNLGVAAGVVFVLAGVLCIIPVSVMAHSIITGFFNPLPTEERRGVCMTCALPMWRVSAFIGANIVTAQVYWEGLWMTCVFQSTGQMQCKVYDSMLALPQDLQAARALTVVSIIVGVLSLLISLVGAKCTNCIEDEGAKARVMISSGAGFIVAALTQLVPVSWSANTIVVEFYSLIIPSGQKMEIGAALYLGWAAAALLLIGGSILCCSCPPKEEKASRYSIHPQSRVAYSAAPKSTAQSSYNRRDYNQQEPARTSKLKNPPGEDPSESPKPLPVSVFGDQSCALKMEYFRHVANKNRLGGIIKVCRKTIGTTLNPLNQIYQTRVIQKAKAILVNPQNPLFSEFRVLPSGCSISVSVAAPHSTIPPSPCFPTATKDKGGAAMSMGLEIVGISLGMLGFLMAIVTCALPMWKVTAFIGANIITAQVIWEGLWMNCVTQSTGQMQCKVYDSLLALSPELQASRAMIIIAIILGVLGVLVSIMGAKCTNCIEDEGAKARVMIVSGIFFVLAGLLVLIPASWYASVIVRDFYNPIVTNAQRRELGAALYIGWGAAALLLIGGAMLCSSCPPKDKRYKPPRMAYSAPRSNNGPAATHDRKDYV
ncbi:uncharacterized protein [Nerophis lumbriciformis]|uniref:uncharacterized protein n=1 Tax=Nerophis lumbriciformis TaxID=546530 RepID=UPI003BAA1C14